MPSITLPAIGATAATASTAASATAASATAASVAAAEAATVYTVGATTAAAGATAAALPSWIGYASLASTLIGGGMGVLGAIQQGQAQKASAEYNAQVAAANEAQAKQNQQMASEAGMAEQGIQEQKTRAAVGSILANEGASGVEINSGSFADTRASATDIGLLDAFNIRTSAAKQAYGYEVQGTNFRNEATLQRSEGQAAETAGNINAASTFLGSVGQAGSDYYKYKLQGGFSV